MTVPFAADYPFLDVLWSMLIFMGFVLWIWLAITCFMDIFRRRDAGGVVKAIWVIVIILAPYLGVLVYLIVNHGGMAERNVKDVQQAQQAFDERVREAARPGAPAAEIEKARGLLESGAINEAEFERLKARALES
jgi:Phospholipase_D-nuclease N-terminal/Short C-terminal domain